MICANPGPGGTGWLRADTVYSLFAVGSGHPFATAGKKQGQAAWNLLFFALWHRAHILGLPPAGDVFDTLAG